MGFLTALWPSRKKRASRTFLLVPHMFLGPSFSSPLLAQPCSPPCLPHEWYILCFRFEFFVSCVRRQSRQLRRWRSRWDQKIIYLSWPDKMLISEKRTPRFQRGDDLSLSLFTPEFALPSFRFLSCSPSSVHARYLLLTLSGTSDASCARRGGVLYAARSD